MRLILVLWQCKAVKKPVWNTVDSRIFGAGTVTLS